MSKKYDDVEAGAISSVVGSGVPTCAAAVGGVTDTVPKGDHNAALVEQRKRSRCLSCETAETPTECISHTGSNIFLGKQEQKRLSCSPAVEASELEDESAGSGRVSEVKCGAMESHSANLDDREDEQYRPRSSTVPFSGVGAISPAASVKKDRGPTGASRLVTLYVPTFFTTAAGRPICLRERRVLDAASPYWKLLRFSPERDAALVSVPSESSEWTARDESPEADTRLSPLPGNTAECAELHSATQQSSGMGNTPSNSSHLGAEWFQPRSPRAHSCPERCYSAPVNKADEKAVYTLPAFTGFCAADGRPFFAPCAHSPCCLVHLSGSDGHGP